MQALLAPSEKTADSRKQEHWKSSLAGQGAELEFRIRAGFHLVEMWKRVYLDVSAREVCIMWVTVGEGSMRN